MRHRPFLRHNHLSYSRYSTAEGSFGLSCRLSAAAAAAAASQTHLSDNRLMVPYRRTTLLVIMILIGLMLAIVRRDKPARWADTGIAAFVRTGVLGLFGGAAA